MTTHICCTLLALVASVRLPDKAVGIGTIDTGGDGGEDLREDDDELREDDDGLRQEEMGGFVNAKDSSSFDELKGTNYTHNFGNTQYTHNAKDPSSFDELKGNTQRSSTHNVERPNTIEGHAFAELKPDEPVLPNLEKPAGHHTKTDLSQVERPNTTEGYAFAELKPDEPVLPNLEKPAGHHTKTDLSQVTTGQNLLPAESSAHTKHDGVQGTPSKEYMPMESFAQAEHDEATKGVFNTEGVVVYKGYTSHLERLYVPYYKENGEVLKISYDRAHQKKSEKAMLAKYQEEHMHHDLTLSMKIGEGKRRFGFYGLDPNGDIENRDYTPQGAGKMGDREMADYGIFAYPKAWTMNGAQRTQMQDKFKLEMSTLSHDADFQARAEEIYMGQLIENAENGKYEYLKMYFSKPALLKGYCCCAGNEFVASKKPGQCKGVCFTDVEYVFNGNPAEVTVRPATPVLTFGPVDTWTRAIGIYQQTAKALFGAAGAAEGATPVHDISICALREEIKEEKPIILANSGQRLIDYLGDIMTGGDDDDTLRMKDYLQREGLLGKIDKGTETIEWWGEITIARLNQLQMDRHGTGVSEDAYTVIMDKIAKKKQELQGNPSVHDELLMWSFPQEEVSYHKVGSEACVLYPGNSRFVVHTEEAFRLDKVPGDQIHG